MSYLDSDFNVFLEKSLTSTSSSSALDFDADVESIDAGKVKSGVLRSVDGKTVFDLDGSLNSWNDGLINRVEIGKFDDGEYGLRIRDRDGNLLLDFTGTRNLIQSPSGRLQADFGEAEQIRAYDQTNLRAIFGKIRE